MNTVRQVQVEIKTDTPHNLSRTIFTFTCYGEAGSQSTKMLLRFGQLNRTVGDLCQPTVRIAYNNVEHIFEVRNNNMHTTTVDWSIWNILNMNGIYDDELLTSFFSSQNLTPIWQNANGNWGSFDEVTERWTGAVGLVS